VGRPGRAEARVRAVAKVRSQDYPASVLLGRTLERQGKQQDAEGAFRKAVELQPTVPEVYIELAGHLLSVGQAKGAVQALQAGLARRPADAPPPPPPAHADGPRRH